MTPERWQRIKDLLQQAMDLAPEERPAFLDRCCSSDHSLRQEVETLLCSSDEARSSFLETSRLQVALTPGTKLEEYEVQKLLGSGGMGEVYRARDLRLRRDVAIKVLPSFLSSDTERLRRFEQEAQAAAALNHPNILAVFQMGSYQGAPYLVSELLEGDTLRVQISRGAMAARKAIEYGVQIAHGLAAAHEKGIVHRDLKPENLFATKDGRIKILDFGLAKLKQPEMRRTHSSPAIGGDGTEPGMVMGTVGYMSPEQVRGKTADHRTDIFALGAILYEMLTGKRAFQKTTSVDTMSAILNEEPHPVSQIASGVPPALQRTIHRCLEKSPDQRFQSASDLAFALEALSDSAVTSLPSGVALPPAKLAWRAIAVSALAVAILAAISFWLFLPERIPVVEGITRLTNDREPKGNLVTDGLRIYFEEPLSSGGLTQVAVSGGSTAIVPTKPGANFEISAITPNLSSLLVSDSLGYDGHLWLMPLPGGEPQRLDLKNNGSANASFFADGRIVWTMGRTVSVAQKDGSNPRKLTDVPGLAGGPVVSPDGSRIRLTVIDDQLHYSMWEMQSDGTGLHQLLKGWPGSLGEAGEGWTPDGAYFIFFSQSDSDGRNDLWLLPEHRSRLGRTRLPIRLTHGPISWQWLKPSPDGRKLFAVGTANRGELVRYDARTRQFVPYLSGLSAVGLTASRDGKWIVYVSYPDHALWRANADGSARVQLTFPPLLVFYPQISLDGTKIAFSGFTEAGLGLYVLQTDNGKIEKLLDFGLAPTWSPDGNSLAFTAVVDGKHFWDETPWCEIRVIDLKTRKISVLPDPLGSRFAPWWPSPNQIVANHLEDERYGLYDLKTGKWTTLSGPMDIRNWTPSLDRTALYMLIASRSGRTVVRMRSPDFKLETVVNLTEMRVTTEEDALGPVGSGEWIGIAADGSPVLTRDVGSNEIYALDVKWP